MTNFIKNYFAFKYYIKYTIPQVVAYNHTLKLKNI